MHIYPLSHLSSLYFNHFNHKGDESFMKLSHHFFGLGITLLLLSTVLCTVSCGQANQTTTTPSTTTQSLFIGTLEPPVYYPPEDYPPEYVSRTEWNIELSIVGTEEGGGAQWLIIEIRDNDNLGFLINNSYILERQEGDSWVPIVNHSQEELTTYIGECPPAENRDYQTTNTPVIRPQEPGHYRVTKYLSFHKVTMEFDITE